MVQMEGARNGDFRTKRTNRLISENERLDLEFLGLGRIPLPLRSTVLLPVRPGNMRSMLDVMLRKENGLLRRSVAYHLFSQAEVREA